VKKGFTSGQIAIALAFLIFLFFATYIFYAAADRKLTNAYKAYKKGEAAATVDERESAFNASLQGYLELQQEYAPTMGTGKLAYNIANAYFQLGEYPFAVLYYNRALSLRPGDKTIRLNLRAARKKLGIKEEAAASPFEDALFFHTYFSLPRRLQLFFLFAIAGFGLLAWQIWFEKNLKIFAIIAFSLAALMALSVLYSRYVVPSEAIVTKAALLRRDAGKEYAPVSENPVAPGSKVQVQGASEEGGWLKISTSDGTVGYLPGSSLQVI